MKITKAVIPAAGLGTRVLPATKAMPKEMFPIVDKPAIQYIVEEAVKGLFERIREISCCYTDDGSSLIDKVMGEKNPCVYINNFSTKSELSEHKGFSSLLKSLYSLFRNPGAHSPREIWQLDKTDALDILGIVSLCHRKLDNAYRVKLP